MEYATKMMRKAIQLAEEAQAQDEVPVGALIIVHDSWVGEGFNHNIGSHDPTAHAEIVALREACRYLENYRLPEAEVFVTLEPCPMCFYALIQARVKSITIGARDPKGGFSNFFSEESLAKMNHQPQITFGVLEEDCSNMISNFFKLKRERGKRKWMKNK